MMSQPIISVRGVSKTYRLGTIGPTSLKDEVARLWSLLRAPKPAAARAAAMDFEALRNVSLDIQPGEVVGIIGRNGAGKSTLLKILSRITEQTSGEIVLRGRIASLLEVGTGFHGDLSGRENIFLNGAILGMSKAEIRRKFDAIVAFAEVEQFIDTPVKRYSSGMYVRLAFAVAAHLEPDILIVDEVLAVGDASFQKKCLGKMREVSSRDHRTVLFVSHNMPTIQALCERVVWLDEGRVKEDGPASEVPLRYLAAANETSSIDVARRTDRMGSGSVRLTAATVSDADGGAMVSSSSRLRIVLDYESAAPVRRLNLVVGIYTDTGLGVYGLDSEAAGELPAELPRCGRVTCVTGPLNLTAGPCVVNVAVLKSGELVDYVAGAARFSIEPENFYGTGKTPGRDWMVGMVRHRWTVGSPAVPGMETAAHAITPGAAR
jgi:homopolymeric O-antigen transport system ATP-binding protein